jgi:uncharacterized membrane protein
VLSALAAASILAGLRTIWLHTTTDSGGLGLVVSLGYAGLLAAVVTAICATRRRTVVRVDALVLTIAVVIEAVQLHRFTSGGFGYAGDEGILASHAIDVFRHGHNPYAYHWASAVAQVPTQLMGGGVVDRFVYPPVTVLLGAVAGSAGSSLATPAFLTGLALIATALLMFAALPVAMRPLAVLVVFGIAFETSRAVAGAPGIIALPFLTAAIWRWPQVGAGGRLGRGGVARAVCLGLAMATYQLAWFVVPFIAVAMWRLRRGEGSRRDAVLIVARYVAVALTTFVVIDLPFAIAGFSEWWHAITSVLTEHALIYGPGIAMVSGNLSPGSGALDFFDYAAAAAYVGLLIAVAVVPVRLAAAASVLPIVVFWLAIRSEDTYYVVFAPLWVLAAVVAVRSDFSSARPIALAERIGHRGRIAAAGVAIALVAAFVGVGLLTPSPLTMIVGSAQRGTAGRLRAIELTVHNRSGHTVHPNFVLLGDAQLSIFWTIEQGPAELQAGQTATYLLRNPDRGFQPTPGSRIRLEAVSDHPQTLSSVQIH